MTLELNELRHAERHSWLLHAVGPRPIAFASTIDKEGNVNLSPFSFFNIFSSNPPVAIFSPSKRGRDNSIKDTLQNVLEVPEVVINICDYDIVQQMSLTSGEFPKDIDEFIKAGLTKQKSLHIKPPMVQEAKVKLECHVMEVKSLGEKGGAGQLVISEIVCMHIDETILNEEGKMIDQRKLYHVARLGGDWYCVVNENNLFKVPRPGVHLGIGVDFLPESIKTSPILTGNNLGQLANVPEMPSVDATFEDERLKNILQYYSTDPDEMEKELHHYAKQLLDAGKINEAWQVLLTDISIS